MGPIDQGFVHEAAIYRTEDEFVAEVVPFLRDGLAAGDPTLLGVDAHRQALVRDALGGLDGVTLFGPGEHFAHPFAALRNNHELFSAHADAGTGRVRMIGEVPHPGVGAPWHGWAEYEAASNELYTDFDAWTVCLYDARLAPDDVLADVERTHGHLATPAGDHRANPGFQPPAEFLAGRPEDDDPLRDTPPHVALADPCPADARHAVAALAARGAALDPTAVGRLVLAVSEAVTNAVHHGGPHHELKAWAAPDRVLVTVRDEGGGPDDPFAGFLPSPPDTVGGLGLWTMRLAVDRVALSTGPDGFTVHLRAGGEPDAAATGTGTERAPAVGPEG